MELIITYTIDEGIDKEYASSLVKKLEYKNDCMTRYKLNLKNICFF